ncbi:uncharacterized protein VTP21DRAFT_2508 [Calcarisporiella thermophila]|uniref:uncharacterized protein n=1 Tax=Calcarisporiella thermophila TaxID=911321 RepID=UPI0037446668
MARPYPAAFTWAAALLAALHPTSCEALDLRAGALSARPGLEWCARGGILRNFFFLQALPYRCGEIEFQKRKADWYNIAKPELISVLLANSRLDPNPPPTPVSTGRAGRPAAWPTSPLLEEARGIARMLIVHIRLAGYAVDIDVRKCCHLSLVTQRYRLQMVAAVVLQILLLSRFSTLAMLPPVSCISEQDAPTELAISSIWVQGISSPFPNSIGHHLALIYPNGRGDLRPHMEPQLKIRPGPTLLEPTRSNPASTLSRQPKWPQAQVAQMNLATGVAKTLDHLSSVYMAACTHSRDTSNISSPSSELSRLSHP